MKRLLMIVLVALGMTSSAAFASTTLTINVTGMSGGTSPGSSIRIDLQNCADAHVLGTGQVVPQTQTIFPVAGIAVVTLFSNTDGAGGGQILCQTPTGQQAVSYYSFSYIFQGVITSVGSYNLIPGTFNLADLTPCVGAACIGSGSGGVTRIIAGNNITISPTNGLGAVTINSSGGGGGAGNPAAPGGSLQGGNAANDSFESANIFLPSQFCSPLGCATPNGIANLFAANGISAITDPGDNNDTNVTPPGNNNSNLRLTTDGFAGFSSINTIPVNRTTGGDQFPSQFMFGYSSTIPGGNGGVGVTALGFAATSTGYGNNTGNPAGVLGSGQNTGWTGSNGFVGSCVYYRRGLNGCTQFGIDDLADGDLNVYHFTVNYQSGLGSAASSEGVNIDEVNAIQYPAGIGTLLTGTTGSQNPTITLTSGQISVGGGFADINDSRMVQGTIVTNAGLNTTTSITTVSFASTGSGQTTGNYLVNGAGGGGTGAQAVIGISGGVCGSAAITNVGVNYTGDVTFTPASGGTPCVVNGTRGTYLQTLVVAGGALTPSTGWGISAGVWGNVTSCSMNGSNIGTVLSANTLDAGQTQTVTFGTLTGSCAFLSNQTVAVAGGVTIHGFSFSGVTHAALSPTTTTGIWQSVFPVPAAALNGDITACAVSNKTVTVTATNTMTTGMQAGISGLSGGCTFLNGLNLYVQSATSGAFTGAIAHADLTTTADTGFYNTPVDGVYTPQNVVVNLQHHLPFTTGKAWFADEGQPETINIVTAPAAVGDVQYLTIQSLYSHASFSNLYQGGSNGCLYFDQNAKPLPPSGTPYNSTSYGLGVPSCYYAFGTYPDSTHLVVGFRVNGGMSGNTIPSTGSEPESFTAPSNGYHVIPMAPVLAVDANHSPLLAFNDVHFTPGDTIYWIPDPALNFHGPSFFLGANTPANGGLSSGINLNLFGPHWTGATKPFTIRNSNPADWYISGGGWASTPDMFTIGGPHRITFNISTTPDEGIISLADSPSSPQFTIFSDCSTCAGTLFGVPTTKTLGVSQNFAAGGTGTFGGAVLSSQSITANGGFVGPNITIKGFSSDGVLFSNPGFGNGVFSYSSSLPVTGFSNAVMSAGEYAAGTLLIGTAPPGGMNVFVVGTPGSTSYVYYMTCNTTNGENQVYATQTVTTGPAVLNGTNNLAPKAQLSPGCQFMKVYRGANGGGYGTGLIATLAPGGQQFFDTGVTASGSLPDNTTNVSGVCTYNGVNCNSGGSSFITSLTTTGSSGPATVVSGVLNIPQYTGGGGISGLTTGQVGIAGSATTLTSSIPIAGAGPGLTSGPNSGVTPGDVALFTGTGGQITDGAIAGSNIMTLSGTQTVTGAKTFSSTVTVTGGSGIQLSVGAFSTLPTCNSGAEGTTAGVNDSTTNTWGATITGSGSDHVMAYCDGSAWTVAGK